MIMLRPRVGQIILTATLFLTVATIVISSIVAAQAHEAERNTVFAEEADGTAMTFVQRESFGVLIALDSWARGASTARDVQIARAVLGQRLGVITNSGTATFDLAGPDYQSSLAELDGYLLELGDVADGSRVTHRSDMQPVIATFSTEVRDLSTTFQNISRRQVQSVLDDRVAAELWQSGLSAFALSLGLALFVWLGVDINRGYRRSARELAVQAATLERTRQRLILLQRIDARSRSWLEAVNRSAPRDDVFAMIRSEIAEIVPGLIVEVRYDHDLPVRVVARAESAVDDDDEALIARAVEIVRLVIARDSGEAELAHQRIHDSLTGLPNRVQFEPLVADQLASVSGTRECAAVLLVDLDRFTDFNGSLGHEAGDDLLLAAAAALRSAAPPFVHLARLSSDEFGAVGTFDSRESALATMHSIVDAVDFEWEHAGVRTRISAGAGVAIAAAGADSGTVIQQAAAAIQLAKSRGERAAFVEYDGALHDTLLTTMHEESALRAAMRAGEFIVHFQPIVDLVSGAFAGAEALVRWERPGVGLVPPNDFLPAISHAGMAAELGREVIDQSLRTWGRMLRSELLVVTGPRAPYVSINVDPAQLDQPSLADFVLTAANRHGVPWSSIVIEVTERSVAGSVLAIDQLTELRSHGVRIALDDFGTGYSSLAQASILPLDILKIDQSFVPRDGLAEQSRRLIGDICGIGATLGLLVTAEGVETDSVAASLRELGVLYGQGYLYSRAIPEFELSAWLSARSLSAPHGVLAIGTPLD